VNSNQAIAASVVAIAAAIIGVLVSAGLPLSKDLQDHILTLITVATPAILAVIAWVHHSNAKVEAARQAGVDQARVNV
jgi:hypothetical protein